MIQIPFRVFLDKYHCLAPRLEAGATMADTSRAIMERFEMFKANDWQVGYPLSLPCLPADVCPPPSPLARISW